MKVKCTPTVVSSEGACTCAETLGAGAGGSVLSGGGLVISSE